MSSPHRGPRRNAGWKRILAYFEGRQTLVFAPTYRCFEFVKQCFMSRLGGGNADVLGGAIAPCPNVEPRLTVGGSTGPKAL